MASRNGNEPGCRSQPGNGDAIVTEPPVIRDASIGLVLDCADPERLGHFWSLALGYTIAGRAGSYVLLTDPSLRRPKLLLQQVPEPKVGKNRLHFDIDTPHVEAEVERLCGHGAVRIEANEYMEHGTHWVVMGDPEGNEFCVCDGGKPGPLTATSRDLP